MDRKHLQFGDDPSIEFVTHDDGEMHIEINNDWCGSTETGFGATLSHTLSVDEIRQLREFLKIYDSSI